MFRLPTQLFGLLAIAIALAGVFASASATEADVEKLAFQIENSNCYVGIAKVKLSVSTLKQGDGKLVGNYKIEVPLKKSKNDSGRIELVIDQSFEQIGEEGGTLRGLAFSDKNNKKPNQIICKIGPLTDKDIELAITTSNRTLNFDSRYALVDTGKDT